MRSLAHTKDWHENPLQTKSPDAGASKGLQKVRCKPAVLYRMAVMSWRPRDGDSVKLPVVEPRSASNCAVCRTAVHLTTELQSGFVKCDFSTVKPQPTHSVGCARSSGMAATALCQRRTLRRQCPGRVAAGPLTQPETVVSKNQPVLRLQEKQID